MTLAPKLLFEAVQGRRCVAVLLAATNDDPDVCVTMHHMLHTPQHWAEHGVPAQ